MGKIGIGHKILYFLREVDRVEEGHFQPPVTCEIDASNHCQNRCSFCIYRKYLRHNLVHLDFDLFKRLIEEFKVMGVNSITFTGGGEPTLNPAFQDMVVHASILNDIDVGLITNGILLDRLSSIIHLLEFVRVSLDAANKETYGLLKRTGYFDKIVENLKRVVDRGIIDVGISMVVVEENKDEVEEFKVLGKNIGVSTVQIKPAWQPFEIETVTENIDPSDSFITERYSVDKTSTTACNIAALVGQVAADGKVYFCCVHRGKKAFCVGDLREDSFYDIMERRMFFHPKLDPCGSCRYMNYAKVYEEVRGGEYRMMRHRRFI